MVWLNYIYLPMISVYLEKVLLYKAAENNAEIDLLYCEEIGIRNESR
jgi:hypothetical protein